MQRGVWLIRGTVFLGLLTLLYYYYWWFTHGLALSPWLMLLFPLAALYATVQLLGNWIIYMRAQARPQAPPWPPGLTVDVFVTVCGEPRELVERSLTAACAMDGPHRTWLLDDGHDRKLATVAARLGAGYLTRDNGNDAKAGNVNAALKRTDGDVVVIFDVDHAPQRDFLTRTIGYFSDPEVGFVQVMLTFGNQHDSWVTQASAETAFDFYNPTSMGMDGMGGATLIGSNALIRRTALLESGGYRPGLAEDLATSLHLQAAGWESVYVAEPLAPGLAPPDLTAWFVQQLKWARGVFELLLTTYPRLFPRLSWGQRLSYAVRLTKYWIGPAIAIHLLATIVVLIVGNQTTRDAFHHYLEHIAPLALADVGIRFVALSIWRHQSTQPKTLARAITLVYASWPTYTLAWLMALLRVPLTFRLTPKRRSGGLHPLWLAPQVVAIILLSVGLWYTVVRLGHPPSVLLLFAIVQGVLQLRLLLHWLRSENILVERLLRRTRRPITPA